ncbi:MAG: alpha/beta hydrolase [Alphaproteobacteria bacterium]
MPIDPAVQALFEQMPDLADPKFWAKSPADVRTLFKAMSQMANPQDLPIGKTEDATVPGEHAIGARVYTPVAAGGDPLPAIVFFHGGGFVVGDLDCYDPLCRMLANESGCRVISVDYRLAPENEFPAAVEDCYATLKWAEASAAALGIDANRIAVAGDSAGGNLAAVSVLLAKDKGTPKPAFQLLIYPAVSSDLKSGSAQAFGEGFFLDLKTIRWFMQHYAPGADTRDKRLIPMSADDVSGLPPAYIITAGCDPLRDGGAAYAEKLKAAGVPVTHVDYPTMIHGFCHMLTLLPIGREAVSAAAKAVKHALEPA